MKAVIGSAVIRGVKAHLDVKEAGCREHRPEPERARVNPANVVTGNPTDVNLYAVYLVHEAVVLKALLGEPRYLSIAPDAVRVDLEAKHTASAVPRAASARPRGVYPAVRAPRLQRGVHPHRAHDVQCAELCAAQKLPGHLVGLQREGDAEAAAAEPNGLTSFPEGLASFAQVPLEKVRTPGIAEGALRKAEKSLDAKATSKARRGLYTSVLSSRQSARRSRGARGLRRSGTRPSWQSMRAALALVAARMVRSLRASPSSRRRALDWRKPLIVGSIVAVAAIALMRR